MEPEDDDIGDGDPLIGNPEPEAGDAPPAGVDPHEASVDAPPVDDSPAAEEEPAREEETSEPAAAATVFQPNPRKSGGSSKADDGAATVFQPAAQSTASPDDEPAAGTWAEGTVLPGLSAMKPQPGARGDVRVGEVLNDLYQITRFIARGGMGEVWEGCNIHDEHDRVAIKVVLPALAADPNVQAMFRKEARTLKRLMHPALVQYRVIATDRRLNILYIVTDYVDGVNLADALAGAKPGPDQLKDLLRRLAEGLRAAHEIGAVHRDMSPDNVILEDGRIDRARIIDFGVAKDLDAAKGTIVGDGFAGKLGFVAPEQFGDFGREVGPWTDVYSLALVVLAAAIGRHPDMGATLVDAVDRRRQGVDVSGAPEALRPVLAAMLEADPAKRLRSMDEVLAHLSGAPVEAPPRDEKPARPFGVRKDGPKPKPEKASAASEPSALLRMIRERLAEPRGRLIVFGAGGLGLLAVGAVVLALVLTSAPTPPPPAAVLPGGEDVRRQVEAAIGGIPCSWLDIDALEVGADGVSMRLSGATGDESAAQAAVSQALANAATQVTDMDMQAVLPVAPPVCAPLDAFRAARTDVSSGANRFQTAQNLWTMQRNAAGELEAAMVVEFNLGDPTLEMALLAVQEDGSVSVYIGSRASLDDAASRYPDLVSSLGGSAYRVSVVVYQTGQHALILLTSRTAFDPDLLHSLAGERPDDWVERVRAAAVAGAWSAEISWHDVVAG